MLTTEPKVLGAGRYLRLVTKNQWEYCERTLGVGVVILVATIDGKLILTEQFRPSVGKMVIELPAGLVGDHQGAEAETMESAARRELLEETGYEANTIISLTDGPTSSGLTNEMVNFYLATNLKKVGPGGGDATENITVHEIPLSEVERWAKTRQSEGVLVDPKIFAGVYFAAVPFAGGRR